MPEQIENAMMVDNYLDETEYGIPSKVKLKEKGRHMKMLNMGSKMNNNLQVKVELQEVAIKFNFDELKDGVDNIAKAYDGAVFTDDSINCAKAEVASLRKIKSAIDTRRKDIKKQFMKPFDLFETQVKELMEIIEKPIFTISAQVDDFENRRVEEKKKQIKELFEKCIGENEFVSYERTYNDKWENKTYKLSDIEKEMTDFFISVMQSVTAIRNLNSDAVSKALELFKNNFSLTNAITYVNNYEQQKQEIVRREEEKRAREEERKHIAEIERIKQEERSRIADEQRAMEESERIVHEEVAKAKEAVIDSLSPDASEETQNYIYKLSLGAGGKESFEMYLDSVGIEWELM